MKTFLLNVTTSGIRNIENEISIDFYRKNACRSFSPSGDRVRAIYGANGSGKTSFVMAVWVLASMLSQKDFLTIQGRDYFSDLFTKKDGEGQEFRISVQYLTYEGSHDEEAEVKCIGKYEVVVSLMDEWGIRYERLSRLSNRSKADSWKTVFEISNGSLARFETHFLSDWREGIIDKTKNLMARTPFAKLLENHIDGLFSANAFPSDIDDSDDDAAIFGLIRLGRSLSVNVLNQDIHAEYSEAHKRITSELLNLDPSALKERILEAREVKDYEVKVPKQDFENYKKYLSRVCEFLRLFKPTLKRIDVSEPRSDGDSFVFRRIFVYEDKSVDLLYESSGVKKMFNLYLSFDLASRGGIVFIDELDANVSGVYLRKLVEYMNDFGEGQLVFTCHSLDPMYALAGKTKSIYFLSEDNLPYAWTKNAHYKPYILYPEGMIPGIPFNLEAMDFIRVFGD